MGEGTAGRNGVGAEPGSSPEAAPCLTPEAPESVSEALGRDLDQNKPTRKISKRLICLGTDAVLC